MVLILPALLEEGEMEGNGRSGRDVGNELVLLGIMRWEGAAGLGAKAVAIMLLKRCEDVVAFVRNEKGGATGRGGEGELQFLERENRGGSCSLQRSVGPWGMFK